MYIRIRAKLVWWVCYAVVSYYFNKGFHKFQEISFKENVGFHRNAWVREFANIGGARL